MRGVKAKELRTLAQKMAAAQKRGDLPARRWTFIRHKPRYIRVPKEQTFLEKLMNIIRGRPPATTRVKVEPIQYVEMEGTVRWFYRFLKRQYKARHA